MKPVRLIMRAFGPYAGEQVIDFTNLRDKTMFLIHGPTGAGKTTILDGICFALYGDTSSGNDRVPKSMRSHFSDPDQLTEVEFIFELRGECYRVTRIPEQERVKKSGNGTTVQSPEASLYKLTRNEEKIIETSYKKVTDKIKELIGFESSQFRQVIMLPQGEFRKLLTAETKDRQEILEKMFHTQVYRAIEESLKVNARRLEDEIGQIRKTQEYLLQRAECEDTDQLTNRIKEDEGLLKGLESIISERDIRLKLAMDTLNKAIQDNMKLEEKKRLETELSRLKEMEEYIKGKKEELVYARKALTLKESEKIVKMLEGDKIRLQLELQKATGELSEAEGKLKKAKENYDRELGREEERKSLENEVGELTSYISKVEQLDKLRVDLSTLEAGYMDSDRLKTSLSERINLTEKEIENKDIELQDINLCKNRLVELSSEYKEEKSIYEKRIRLEELRNKLGETEKECEQGEKAYKYVKEEYEKAKRQYVEMQEKWSRGQAGVLAETLEENKPCPVCGSIHHPQIARKEDGIPSEGELKLKERKVASLEEEREAKRAVHDKIILQKMNLENQLNNFLSELGEVAKKNPIELKQSLEEKIAAARPLKEKADRLELVKEELEKKKNILSSIKKEYEDNEKVLSEKGREYQELRGSFKLLEESIPLELRVKEELAKKINGARESLERLKREFEGAKLLHEKMEKEYTAVFTRLQEIEKNLAQTIEKCEKEGSNFKEKLLEAGFKNAEDFERAKDAEIRIGTIEEEIKSYGEKVHSVEERLKQLLLETEGILDSDIKSLEDIVKEAQEYRDAAMKEQMQIINRVKENKRSLREIEDLEKKTGEKMEQYKVIGDISEVANGNNSYRLTLERFVLGSLLDDITAAATERLKLMSRGRYYLSRTMDVGRKNGKAGLDLQVFDNYTGMERQVSTLSGGESFLASLSLALGLADVVQSYSGGLSLDTIFIDEGFGTLDPEALDFAMKTLIDLQKGGRLVGIISHVPELKERMDARLEIIKTDRGSRAKFCVV